MLSQWFQPEPFFKGLPLAKALRDRGHNVEVLTGFPNYPGGKLYPGYRVQPWRRETLDGIRVNRVALYPSHNRSGFRRAMNYLSFGASAALVGPCLVRKPDVLYVYNLITLACVARLFRRLKASRILLDVQDLWPESVIRAGMMSNRLLTGVLERWCKMEYGRADRLVVLSPGFKRHLAARGVPKERIDVIYNWCDEDAVVVPPPDDALARQLGFPGRFNIVFAGTMGVAQALDVVIDAAKRLQDAAPDVQFHLVGGGIDVERLRRTATGLSNVQFLPPRPMSQIGSIYSIADALLVHLKKDPLFEITIPSKIQAYLHAGKPILAGVRGDAADLVRQAEAGIPFESEDADSLVQGVLALRKLNDSQRRRMGARGRAYYKEHLAFSEAARQLEQSLERAVRGN